MPPTAIPAVCALLSGGGLESPPAVASVDVAEGGDIVPLSKPVGTIPVEPVASLVGRADAPDVPDVSDTSVDASDGLADPLVEIGPSDSAIVVGVRNLLSEVGADCSGFAEVSFVSTTSSVGLAPVLVPVIPLAPVVTAMPRPDVLISDALVEPKMPVVSPGSGSKVRGIVESRSVAGVVTGLDSVSLAGIPVVITCVGAKPEVSESPAVGPPVWIVESGGGSLKREKSTVTSGSSVAVGFGWPEAFGLDSTRPVPVGCKLGSSVGSEVTPVPGEPGREMPVGTALLSEVGTRGVRGSVGMANVSETGIEFVRSEGIGRPVCDGTGTPVTAELIIEPISTVGMTGKPELTGSASESKDDS